MKILGLELNEFDNIEVETVITFYDCFDRLDMTQNVTGIRNGDH